MDAVPDGQLVLLDVSLEVIGQLIFRRQRAGRCGERRAGESVQPGRSNRTQRIPALAPRLADVRVSVENDEIDVALRQVKAGGETRLASADDHNIEALGGLHHPLGLILRPRIGTSWSRPLCASATRRLS